MVKHTHPQDLQQTYPAVPESVRAGRRALTRFAAGAGASSERVEAVGLAASEALTNAVKHAYPHGEGTVHLTAAVAGGELRVLIADDGCGIRPHVSHGGPGLGLTLIASLCDEVQIAKRSSGGTEVGLWFKLRTEPSVLAGHLCGSVAFAKPPRDLEHAHGLRGDVSIDLKPPTVGAGVVHRPDHRVDAAAVDEIKLRQVQTVGDDLRITGTKHIYHPVVGEITLTYDRLDLVADCALPLGFGRRVERKPHRTRQ